jgi:hypothetical protein
LNEDGIYAVERRITLERVSMNSDASQGGVAPAAHTLAAQQRRFDGFVEEFNWARLTKRLASRTRQCACGVDTSLFRRAA